MRQRFVSIDRRDQAEADYAEPDRYRDLRQQFAGDAPLIARGAGLSYVGASFGDGVRSVGMCRFNRLLAFDAAAKTVTVEAGMSIGRLQQFLVTHGLTLAVQPGHPDITVGGCVACNVHGKNQYREGTFRRWVRGLTLMGKDGERVLTPGDPLFDLTIGGFGLTGIILTVSLDLVLLSGTGITQELVPVGSLAETAQCLLNMRDDYDLLYSWNDLGCGSALGSGFVVAGRYTQLSGPLPALRSTRLTPTLPHPARRVRLMHKHTIPWVSRLYRYLENRHPRKTLGLFDFMYPAATKGIYFQMFGENFGFVEHQVLIPQAAWQDYVGELERLIRHHSAPIALTSMKLFGGGDALWVDYSGDGINLCLDVLAEPAGLAFLADLDQLDLACGVRATLYKDSRLAGAIARKQYPRFDAMVAALADLDPARRMASTLSRRLGL